MPHRTPVRRVSTTLVGALLALLATVLAATPAHAVTAPAIVPFEQWAGPACPTPTGADPWPVDRVVVHHTHDPVATTQDAVVATLREICTLHLRRGFDTIGYHYVVDPWGTVWQARGELPGGDGTAPRVQAEGAHAAGANPGAIGVAFLGDHEAKPPSDAAVSAAVQLLAWLSPSTGVDPHELVTIETTGQGTSLVAGHVQVHALDGHSATNATLCPGQHLTALLDPLRDAVAATVAGAPATTGGTLRAPGLVTSAPEDAGTHTASLRPIAAAPDPPVADPAAALRLLGLGGLLAFAADSLRRRLLREGARAD